MGYNIALKGNTMPHVYLLRHKTEPVKYIGSTQYLVTNRVHEGHQIIAEYGGNIDNFDIYILEEAEADKVREAEEVWLKKEGFNARWSQEDGRYIKSEDKYQGLNKIWRVRSDTPPQTDDYNLQRDAKIIEELKKLITSKKVNGWGFKNSISYGNGVYIVKDNTVIDSMKNIAIHTQVTSADNIKNRINNGRNTHNTLGEVIPCAMNPFGVMVVLHEYYAYYKIAVTQLIEESRAKAPVYRKKNSYKITAVVDGEDKTFMSIPKCCEFFGWNKKKLYEKFRTNISLNMYKGVNIRRH